MARGFIRVYRTYLYKEKNPVIDKVRTLIQDEGLMKDLNAVHQISGVATTTLNNWFDGPTKNPQHSTIAAVITALGYREEFVKDHDIDLQHEKEVAAQWYKKQEKQKAKPSKTNGSRPGSKR